jgi:hypothetical protein
MVRLIASLLLSTAVLTGCMQSQTAVPTTSEKPAPGGVKFDAPGVKVDAQKDKGVKVNVAPEQ